MEALLADLEKRVSALEEKEPRTKTSKRDERMKVREAIESGEYDELIGSGGHGLIQLVADTLAKDLEIDVQYSTVYYILKIK